MRPLLSFIGGCEFSYLIEELKSDPSKYFDFECSHTFSDSGATDAYLYVTENADSVIAEKPDAVIISQVDAIRKIMQATQFSNISSKGHVFFEFFIS